MTDALFTPETPGAPPSPGSRPPAALSPAAGGTAKPQPRVIGLDLSIAATGLADGWLGYPTTRTVRTNPKDFGKEAAESWRRLTFITYTISRVLLEGLGPVPTLVAVEGPSYGSKGAGTWDRGGLWWMVYDDLTRRRLRIAVVPPAVLKKYATGKGNADKTAMAVALQRRADIELGDDNQVDAWWLAAAALDHLGHPIVDLPKAQREALAKVAWPEVTR